MEPWGCCLLFSDDHIMFIRLGNLPIPFSPIALHISPVNKSSHGLLLFVRLSTTLITSKGVNVVVLIIHLLIIMVHLGNFFSQKQDVKS